MNNLDFYFKNYLLNFFDISNYNIIFINKKYYYFYLNFFKNIYIKQKNFIKKNNFNKDIINLFGGIHKFSCYPILKWNNNYLGSTNYIDNIDLNHISNNIMIGVDKFKRPFITIRTFNDKIVSLTILFQRYSDDYATWSHANINNPYLINESGYFYCNGNIIHKLLKNNIQNLLNKEKYIKYFDFNGNIIKKKIYLI